MSSGAYSIQSNLKPIPTLISHLAKTLPKRKNRRIMEMESMEKRKNLGRMEVTNLINTR